MLDSAAIIEQLFGGRQITESEHRVTVGNTRFGDFVVELDWQGAHEPDDDTNETGISTDLELGVRAALGHAAAVLVPTEIVCPPIPWNELDELDPLFSSLRKRGASGTEDGLLYGFGLHLNPEVAEETADYVLRHLQAYAILEEWLRETIDIDATRRLFPHVDPLPKEYVCRILSDDYTPDTTTLIRDYVAGNPTRNRGLDMTPLFRHLDEDTLLAVLEDASLVKARPTFHYRLPNAHISDETWSATVEWNRWLEVEKLASTSNLLSKRRTMYSEWLSKPAHARWLETLNGWFT